jgi:hypothetical protein
VPHLVAVVAVLTVAWLVVAQASLIETESTVDVGPWVDAVVPVNGCSFALRTYLAVMSDRFESSVAGCTTITDPQSTLLVYQDGPGGAVPAYRAALDHTDYLVLDVTLHGWLSGPLEPLYGYVAGHFQLRHSGPLYIYVRDGFPVA